MQFNKKISLKLIILQVLVILTYNTTYGQDTIYCDTVESKEHYLLIRCMDTRDSDVYYDVHYPGCFTSSISIEPGQKVVPPIISFCMPYNDYIEYGRTIFEISDVIVSYSPQPDSIMDFFCSVAGQYPAVAAQFDIGISKSPLVDVPFPV